jgi:hypothetical protein
VKNQCKYCKQGRPLEEDWEGNLKHLDVNGLAVVECGEFDEIAELKAQLEACQAQQQAAVEAARVAENIACENIAKEYITFGLESPTDGDLIAARIRERRGAGNE